MTTMTPPLMPTTMPNPFPRSMCIDGYPTATSIEQQQTEQILATHRRPAPFDVQQQQRRQDEQRKKKKKRKTEVGSQTQTSSVSSLSSSCPSQAPTTSYPQSKTSSPEIPSQSQPNAPQPSQSSQSSSPQTTQPSTPPISPQTPPKSRPSPSLPLLHRNLHLQWLARNFSQGFPSRFVSQDASQPWLVYWTVQSVYVLGAEFDPVNKQRCIDTLMACQHPTEGGFGGGPGQNPHLLPTYAAVSALAIVGRPGRGGGWDQIDRKKLYAFMLSLKQPDGSFLVSRDSEVDVRGIYCLLCVAVMLNLVTPELIEGTAKFVAGLQTYEGGFASASHSYYIEEEEEEVDSVLSGQGEKKRLKVLDYPRPPLGEAHGGYTFCALASWVILHPLLDISENKIGNKGEKAKKLPEINLRTLTRWLVNMQGNEAELGGFRGRTNKLVDACYAWWVGGCFPLMRALGVGGHVIRQHGGQIQQQKKETIEVSESEEDDDAEESEDDEEWADLDDELFNRIGLQEYILYAGQHPMGGLRDKPPKPADSYHTLYSLAGLSSAQHYVSPDQEIKDKLLTEWKLHDNDMTLESVRKTVYVEARSWKEDEGASVYVGSAMDRVNATHPVFNLTVTHVRNILNHFYEQSG